MKWEHTRSSQDIKSRMHIMRTPKKKRFSSVDMMRFARYLSDGNKTDRQIQEAWLNVYKAFTSVHGTKEHADIDDLYKTRLACIPKDIDCEVGEGLCSALSSG